MPRVHASDITPTCGEDDRQSLYVAMNRRDERVKIKTRALAAVTACHAAHGAKPPLALVSGAKEIDRITLFNFMTDHAEVCGRHVGPDWEPTRIVRARRMEAARLKTETAKLQRQNKKARTK